MTAINPAIYAMGAIFAGPTADGTNGQVLVTNGAKQLSFTTIASGVSALNALTGSLSIAVGTSGTDVAVSASGSTVTVNIPDAGASARGVITTGTQTIAGAKTFSSTGTVIAGLAISDLTAGRLPYVGTAGRLADSAGAVMDSNGKAKFYSVECHIGSGVANPWVSIGSYTLEIAMADAVSIRWSSDYVVSGTKDLGIRRNAAGVLEVNSGTASAFRDLKLRKLDATEGVSVGPITFSVLNALTATATLGVYRITDRANRLAYPDGTNWRFVADDAIIS